MYSDENKSAALARFLNAFDYALIDTCSLMDDGFPLWMDTLKGSRTYRKKGFQLFVPWTCYQELKKHVKNKGNDSKRIAAKRGLRILRKAKWHKLLSITKKDKNANFADNAIYVQVGSDRLFSKILVITQDRSLATDLLALNKLRSQSGRLLEVSRITLEGRLAPNKGAVDFPKEQRKEPGRSPEKKNGPKPRLTPLEEVIKADERLCAVINNPTYPLENKIRDAKAQIASIEALPETSRTHLNLHIAMPRLREIAAGKIEPAKEKATPAPEAEKPAPAKKPKPVKTEEPAPKPAQKAAAKTKTVAKEAPKKTGEAPAAPKEKPAKKATPKAKKEPAPEAPNETPAKPAKEPKPKPTPEELVEKAIAEDRKLRANLSNPNYALKKKRNDLTKQRALIKKLPKDKEVKLTYGIPEIEAWLKANPLPVEE